MPVETFEQLTSATFDSWIAEHTGVIIFHKKLCPHCKIMGTVLDKVNANMPIAIASVDSEDEPELRARVGADRVPTLCAVKNGAIHATFTGIMNPNETAKWLKQ